MNKFAIAAVMCVLFAGMFHMIFIMYDYAFWHDEDGAFYKLSDRLNESLDATRQQDAFEQGQMFRQGFGICRVICIGMCIVFLIAAGLSRTPEQGG
jgi:hypothetical protein